MVDTFLKMGRYVFQKIRIMALKMESEKVADMVGTFLNEDMEGFQKIRIIGLKTELKT